MDPALTIHCGHFRRGGVSLMPDLTQERCITGSFVSVNIVCRATLTYRLERDPHPSDQHPQRH